MSTPGEIVTVGLGNFGTLCAAHWCNSLTRYDAEHEVVFSQTKQGGRPRLLLLDAHQPSALKSLDHGPAAVSQAPQQQLFADADLLDQVGFRNYGSPDDDGEDYEEDEEEEDEEEDGQEQSTTSGGRGSHVDPEGDQQKKRESKPMSQRKLFKHKVTDIPWWKYITVPLRERSLLSCDSQHLNPDGEVGLGSFGYGQNTWSMTSSGGSGSGGGTLPQFYDNLRYFLEECDRCQGIQVFADCNSAFGGLAASLASELKDDFGRGLPLMIHAAQLGKRPPHAANLTGAELAEEEQQKRSQAAMTLNEQASFNRLWSTHMLSSRYDLFCPLELSNLFATKEGEEENPLATDEISQAAYLASATDTALYPCREDGSSDKKHSDSSTGGEEGETYTSHLSMPSLCGLLRPSNGMRVVGLFSNTLLFPKKPHQPTLWDTLTTHPLLGAGSYLPCSFHFKEKAYECDEGLVLGHSLSLRGFASLKEERYPHAEAVLRYVLPLRTTRYHGSMSFEPYPLSVSFPEQLLKHIVTSQKKIGSDATAAALGRRDQAEVEQSAPMSETENPGEAEDQEVALSKVKNIAVASHLINTNGCAPYLKDQLSAAKRIMHHKHRHVSLYGYEDDEWHECLDDVAAVRDEYDHAPPSDNGSEFSEEDNDDGW